MRFIYIAFWIFILRNLGVFRKNDKVKNRGCLYFLFLAEKINLQFLRTIVSSQFLKKNTIEGGCKLEKRFLQLWKSIEIYCYTDSRYYLEYELGWWLKIVDRFISSQNCSFISYKNNRTVKVMHLYVYPKVWFLQLYIYLEAFLNVTNCLFPSHG